jgi:hypothetical protein
MSVTKCVPILALAALASLGAIGPTLADMRVLESTDPHYQRDQRISGNAIDLTTLAPGSHVRVLLLESNATTIFARPPAQNDAALPFGGTRGLKRKPQ